MDILTELKLKKDKIEKLTHERLRLEGELQQQQKQLKDVFKISTLEEADVLLKELEEEKTELDLGLAKCKKALDKIDI